MPLPGADKAAKAPRLAETWSGRRYIVTPSHSQKERLRWIEPGAFDERGKLIALEIHGDETDVFGFIRNRSGSSALPGLAAGVVHFEDHRVLETIQTPGAAIQTGAEDDQLFRRLPDAIARSRITVRN